MGSSSTTQAFAMAEAMFTICILIAVLTPRVVGVHETSWFAGVLSRPFRIGFFAVTCTLTIRCFLIPDRRFQAANCYNNKEYSNSNNNSDECQSWVSNLFFSWLAVESVFLAFLKLCMPYLLQRRLSTVINIVPGKDLHFWLYMVVLVDLFAISLSANVAPQFWAAKRLGDGLLAIPVIRTIKIYKRVSRTSGQQVFYNSLMDTLISLETCRFVLVVGAALGYALDDHDHDSNHNKFNDFWTAVRLSSIFLGYVSVFMHATLLNLIDEQHFLHEQAAAAASTRDASGMEDPLNSSDLTLALIPRTN